MILVFFVFMIFFFLFLILNFFFSFNFFSFNKVSSFECGFDTLGLIQISFGIHFFLILVVFVVFDMELVIFLGFIFLDFNSIFIFFFCFFFMFFSFFLEYSFCKFYWVV